MIGEYSTAIGSSISPVTNRDVEQQQALDQDKELAQEGEKEKEPGDGTPAPAHDEEVRQPRLGRRPMAPTKAEIEEHYPLHLNYRSWCEHCRAGKARQSQHMVETQEKERLGVTFNADYAFHVPEEREEDMQPSLVMYDDDKDSFWAIGLDSKGVVNRLLYM